MAYAVKKGAVSLAGAPECTSISFSHKSLPGGDSSPLETSFSKKMQYGSGENRLLDYRADTVMRGPGG